MRNVTVSSPCWCCLLAAFEHILLGARVSSSSLLTRPQIQWDPDVCLAAKIEINMTMAFCYSLNTSGWMNALNKALRVPVPGGLDLPLTKT